MMIRIMIELVLRWWLSCYWDDNDDWYDDWDDDRDDDHDDDWDDNDND